ncbi:MAG TPA: hypothetical protein VER58_08060 [Thermoanaerobaculia bacterium]|nr:hypothetical protein [Thermoanaerobaculia bacterium]
MVKIIAAAAILALGAGLIEESADSIGPILRLVIMFLVPVVVAIMARRRVIVAIVLALFTFAAAYGGQQCFQRAYNDCVRKAGDIKGTLDHYRRAHGRYPANLADALPQPPCIGGKVVSERRPVSTARIAT